MKRRASNETRRLENISSVRCSTCRRKDAPWLATCLTSVRQRTSASECVAKVYAIALRAELGDNRRTNARCSPHRARDRIGACARILIIISDPKRATANGGGASRIFSPCWRNRLEECLARGIIMFSLLRKLDGDARA